MRVSTGSDSSDGSDGSASSVSIMRAWITYFVAGCSPVNSTFPFFNRIHSLQPASSPSASRKRYSCVETGLTTCMAVSLTALPAGLAGAPWGVFQTA